MKIKQWLLEFSQYVDKIALAVFAFPASYELAATLAPSPFWQIPYGVAGGLTVDAFMLAALLRLEEKESAPLAEKALDIIGALVMYGVVVAVAVQTGEGTAGVTFRIVIGWGVLRVTVGALIKDATRKAETRNAELDDRLKFEARVDKKARKNTEKDAVQARETVMRNAYEYSMQIENARLLDTFNASLAAADAVQAERESLAMREAQAELQTDASEAHKIVPYKGGYVMRCPHSTNGYAVNGRTGEVIKHDTIGAMQNARAGHLRGKCKNGNGVAKRNGTRMLA
jgi:hypothetical protein